MALGLIGKKLGMTQVYSPQGELIPVTVIQTGPCTVVQVKNAATDGYAAVQLGFGDRKAVRVSKALRGHCAKVRGEDSQTVFAVLREFRVGDDVQLTTGQAVTVDQLFKAGDRVDVTGTTKGRGFSGVIKRHRFSGFPGSHGTHEYFRHGGSIGNRSFPGRVFKGKRMAGQYGNERITTQNLEVVAVRPEDHVILVRGAVAGARSGVVLVHPAVKGAKSHG